LLSLEGAAWALCGADPLELVLGGLFVLDDRGLDWLGDGSNSGVDFTEFLPMEKPIPKKTAHKITRPKNRASILPVPRVISVSLASSMRVAVAGAIKVVGSFVCPSVTPSTTNATKVH